MTPTVWGPFLATALLSRPLPLICLPVDRRLVDSNCVDTGFVDSLTVPRSQMPLVAVRTLILSRVVFFRVRVKLLCV